MNFLNGSSKPEDKIVHDYQKLAAVTRGIQAVGRKAVVTIGSWDMLHIGHSRYLMKAREQGHLLIVGVDSDRAIQLYKKSKLRPVVPESERCEMLSFLSFVDFITLLDDVDGEGAWQYGLIEVVRPDIFIAVEGSYPDAQLADIRKHVGHVKVLPRQAETSTSIKIDDVVKNHMLAALEQVTKR